MNKNLNYFALSFFTFIYVNDYVAGRIDCLPLTDRSVEQMSRRFYPPVKKAHRRAVTTWLLYGA